MRKKSRRKLFYLLLALFLIVSPLLIAYSLGYNFDFFKGRVGKTGGIFIKSKTAGISIFINGTFEKETSLFSGGALLTDIAPQTYLLRLEKEAYQPWSKAVAVEPSIVTEIRNILLLPRPVTYATSTAKEIALFLEKNPPAKLLIDKKDNLIRPEGAAKKILASNVNSFAEFEEYILFVDKNGFLAKMDPATNKIETLGRPGFYLNKNKMTFVKSAGGAIAILDSSGGLFLLESDNKVSALKGGVKKISFDGGGHKLLLTKEQSVEILRLQDNPEQPFQKKGAFEEILKLDSPINEASWFYADNAHIAIRTDAGIFFTEVDGRGGRNTAELVSDKINELLTSEKIPDAVFFRKGKIWFKIKI